MSNFALLSTDASLLELAMKARWGSKNFCPVVKSFQVQVIMQAQLNTLSQEGVWGDVGKPWWDMAFHLIMPSIAVGYERSLAWWQCGCIPTRPTTTLEEVACKLAQLVDESMDWFYTFVWLNKTLSHVSPLSEGHVSAMMDGTPSADAQGRLHLLQICKLLQHKDMVVCPEGLNGKFEALQFTFQELPLWNPTAPSKSAHKP